MSHSIRKRTIWIACLGLVALLLGCTSTDAFTSIGDDFKGVASDSLLFIVTTDLLENRESQNMEYAFIDALADFGIVGMSWIDLFPPVKNYNAKEYAKEIIEQDIDVIVYINLQDSLMESGTYVTSSGNVYPYSESSAMFEFTFQHTEIDDPIMVVQVTVDGSDVD